MLLKNEYHIEPGVYRANNKEGTLVVLTELVTHQYVNGTIEKKPEPDVVYRDVIMPHDKYITYCMKLGEFKQKFSQV